MLFAQTGFEKANAHNASVVSHRQREGDRSAQEYSGGDYEQQWNSGDGQGEETFPTFDNRASSGGVLGRNFDTINGDRTWFHEKSTASLSNDSSIGQNLNFTGSNGDMPYVTPVKYFISLIDGGAPTIESDGPLNSTDFFRENLSKNGTISPLCMDATKLSTLVIYGMLLPIIAVLGILLNLASFIVLNRRSMRSSVNVYLAGLSCFDGLLLLVALLTFPPFGYCECSVMDGPFWCQFVNRAARLTYPLLNVMQTGSIWTITAITIDRFVAINWPLQSRKYLTIERSVFVLIVVFFFSIIYNVPSFFELTPNINGTLERSQLRQNPIYVQIYKSYCYLFFMFLIPVLLMIVLNVFVTLSVRRAYVVRREMSGRDEKERRCTVMAVLVAGTFLVLNLTANIANCIEAFSPDSSYIKLVEISNLLVTVNSAINFFIYCSLSQKFKQMFCKLFCPLCYTPEREYKYLSAYFGSMRPQGLVLPRSANAAVPYEAGGIISMRSLRRPLMGSASQGTTPVEVPQKTKATPFGGRTSCNVAHPSHFHPLTSVNAAPALNATSRANNGRNPSVGTRVRNSPSAPQTPGRSREREPVAPAYD